MKVNGTQVDALQWLQETGGTNAIKRFSAQQVQAQSTQKKPSDQLALSKEDAAALKMQVQYNRAGIVPGAAADAMTSYLAQLKAQKALAAEQPTAAHANNTVSTGPAKTNTTAVTGKNNSVDFRAPTGTAQNNAVTVAGEGNIVQGYNGGQKNNTITVTGDTNRLFAGENVSNSAATLEGSRNTVNFGADASGDTVAVKGSGVKVSIGSAGLAEGSNQNWKISVEADNVDVSVVNGKATVNMSDEQKSKYEVSIDDAAKSVSIMAA